MASLQKAEASDAGWNLWFCIRREPRELIGNAGFKGSPKARLVEIGYSMLEIHQRHGYATEALRGLLSWAFQSPAVQVGVADTLPGLTPSIRVMEKSGFAFVGDGPVEDGMRTIRYELTRERFQALASEWNSAGTEKRLPGRVILFAGDFVVGQKVWATYNVTVLIQIGLMWG